MDRTSMQVRRHIDLPPQPPAFVGVSEVVVVAGLVRLHGMAAVPTATLVRGTGVSWQKSKE
ncbi:hypothetical protein [Frankia sp. Cr1]|uniref:hypothetical protein n=1 Tax=Frankia sp. Cr1 TaxID=3073931 RepID=UPI002AD4FFFA|nr:hypothetical protein [Frankia sp. Cr1]